MDPIDCGLPVDARRDSAHDLSLEDGLAASIRQPAAWGNKSAPNLQLRRCELCKFWREKESTHGRTQKRTCGWRIITRELSTACLSELSSPWGEASRVLVGAAGADARGTNLAASRSRSRRWTPSGWTPTAPAPPVTWRASRPAPATLPRATMRPPHAASFSSPPPPRDESAEEASSKPSSTPRRGLVRTAAVSPGAGGA
ncbi:hypothetical protein T484DRAFT_1942012 [Baffinella frigidus]|nr:hypothetical protein T484DRAFT_1942012 [Cryptophyta sp. CCMP2293]